MQRGKKATIAMHCKLRPPDVALVVISFNYEANNAPVYQISTQSVNEHEFVMTAQIFPESDTTAISELLSVFLVKFVLRINRNCYF